MEGYSKFTYIFKDTDMYVSDLIIYITSIISPKEQNKILIILKSILDNYQIASEISEKLFSIAD